MSAMASQITSLTIVYLTVYSILNFKHKLRGFENLCDSMQYWNSLVPNSLQTV